MNDTEDFLWTLKVGEKILSLQYTDYDDARKFSEKNYAGYSNHFIEHFNNHSNIPKGKYEHDLFRYVFIKAIEARISSDLYSQTSRGDVCDTFNSPFDIFMQTYPTNLPFHLEKEVNSNQQVASQIADNVCEHFGCGKYVSTGILNALQFLGQTVGYHIGQDNLYFKGYLCSEMLTRNEIYQLAGSNFCTWLKNNGYEILGANFTRDTPQNIVARKSEEVHILISAAIAPKNPSFNIVDLDILYDYAKSISVTPYYASISIASQNPKHQQDGIILYGDKTLYRVNAFNELQE